MSIQVTVTLPIDSADELVGYGAGAKVYLYSSATEAGVYVLVTSTVIVSGTESYEIWDSGGTSTTWYKSRVGDTGASAFSEYSDPFQVGAQPGYTNLVRVKRQLKITDTSDDAFLVDCVDSANAWLIGEVGRFYGPSTDTDRSFDLQCDATEVLIGGGVRTVTTLEVRTVEAGALTTVDPGRLRPAPQARGTCCPASSTTASSSSTQPTSVARFYAGRDMVKVTGSFGPAVPPLALTRIADTVAVWLFQSRQTGPTGHRRSPTWTRSSSTAC